MPADRIVFSGVAKSEFEIEFALKQGIFCFNVESVPELERCTRLPCVWACVRRFHCA